MLYLGIMKKPFFVVLLLVVLSFGAVFVANQKGVQAEESAYRCEAAQNFIKTTVRSNDLKTRVDRVQLYQFIHDNLEVIAKRLNENKQPGAEQMQTVVNSYQKKLDTFKTDYENYDGARQAVSDLQNCSKNQRQFDQLLKAARKKRTIVATDIKELQLEISDRTLDTLEQLETQLAGSKN